MADNNYAQLPDEYFNDIADWLKESSSTPFSGLGPDLRTDEFVSSETISFWHNRFNLEEICRLCEDKNPKAIQHMYDCEECQQVYRQTRGQEFNGVN